MKNTTLVHIEKDGAYLMMHRIKKENDCNKDKWIGVGGKFLENETPEECAVRETYEETGLTIINPRLRGVITFISDRWEGEYMYLFSATEFTGEITQCDEGVLEWVPKDKLCELPVWEGDRLFFEELNRDRGFFTMKLKYEGERLVEHEFCLYK